MVGLLAAATMLAGCTTSLEQWRNGQAKTKADFAHMRGQARERDNYAACIEQGALPGTPENLTCQLELAKKGQEQEKPNPQAQQP